MASAHIVLVDDDPALRAMLEERLSRPGVTVHTLVDGDKLSDVVAEKDPGLVILDVVLPGKNGYQLCRQLRAAHPELPIFLFSGKGEPADRFWADEVGATEFFQKPMDLRRLVERAAELVGNVKSGA